MRFNIPLQGDKAAEAVAEIRAEIKRLREETVSRDFLEGVRAYAEGEAVTGALTSLERLNERLLEIVRGWRRAGYQEDALRGLRALTAEDLKLAAQTMLDTERLVWVFAGETASVERELGVEGFSVVGPSDVH